VILCCNLLFIESYYHFLLQRMLENVENTNTNKACLNETREMVEKYVDEIIGSIIFAHESTEEIKENKNEVEADVKVVEVDADAEVDAQIDDIIVHRKTVHFDDTHMHQKKKGLLAICYSSKPALPFSSCEEKFANIQNKKNKKNIPIVLGYLLSFVAGTLCGIYLCRRK